MDEQGRERFGLRLQLAVYVCGIFSSGASNLIWVVVPLWAVSLGLSPVTIGIALGSYTFLPLLLSIPGGALIDRLGARRVMFLFGIIVVGVSPFYPALPWLSALIGLQMVAGLAISMGWIGAQSLIGQRMRGEAVYAGRLAFATRLGALAGPPIIGAIWDVAGPWGAFAFVSLWTSGMLVGVALLPRSDEEAGNALPPVTLREFHPRLSSYREAFGLLHLAPILLVVVISVLRQSGQGIQSSFYIVYLQDLGFGGTAIGTLLSAFLVTGAFGALAVGRLTRLFNPFWLLIVATTLAVALITITPLLGSFLLLLGVISLRGAVIGIDQPLMLSIVSRAADAQSQGRAVALRATANRLAMTVIPVIMGGVVEVVGIEDAFFVVGGTLILLLATLALLARKSPALKA
ncbi:MAG TPA: MFS transporter [Alphaproteobacteria bacterium]